MIFTVYFITGSWATAVAAEHLRIYVVSWIIINCEGGDGQEEAEGSLRDSV